MTKQTLFYKDKPLFGLDIGHDAMRIMQTKHHGGKPQVVAYGDTVFAAEALKDGAVVAPQPITEALQKLLQEGLTGKLGTRRAVIGIPAYRTYSRSIQLPPLEGAPLAEAIRLEAEQYIPVPLQNLYLDYTVTSRTNEGCEVYMVAVPQAIVDGFTSLAEAAGLEVVAFETTTAAQSRLFGLQAGSSATTALVDFSNLSGSISLYSGGTTLVTGTMPVGGQAFTKAIQAHLKLSEAKAEQLKTEHGLHKSKWQKDITKAVTPALDQVVSEIRRTLRYFEERYGEAHRISQVAVLGGGSGLPGLSEYLTEKLTLPAATINPWDLLDYGKTGAPRPGARPVYAAVAGLSLLQPKELFI